MKLTNRMLVVLMLWVSVFASAGYYVVQRAEAETAAVNVFAAPGVTASANGYVSTEVAPDLAIDGHLDSGKWMVEGDVSLPAADKPYWLKVDAGSEVTVQRFIVAHAGAGGELESFITKDFTIEASSDDETWTPVVTVTGNTSGLTTHDLEEPVQARYFKLAITNPGDLDQETGHYAAQIYEFQAFGFALDQSEEPGTGVTADPIALPAGVAQSAVGNVNGLLAEYYAGTGSGNNFGFGAYKATMIDPLVNFTDLNPILATATGGEDGANVRWSGQIMPPETGEYTFYMMGDNGFRLWIDDELVIDHWVNDWDKEQISVPIQLEGSRKYKMKIEYFEDYGGANLYLRWSTATIAKEIVPSNAFFLPADYTGAASGFVAAEGNELTLTMLSELAALPAEADKHIAVTADGIDVAVESIEATTSNLQLKLAKAILPGQRIAVRYDSEAGMQYADGTVIGGFAFTPVNLSNVEDYSPIAIAMSLYGSAKTNRSFAWYTNYNRPQSAPANATDSIVEVVPAIGTFDAPDVLRFIGKPEETRILNNLKITSSTTGSFISHKVLVEGLTPGTAYKYRVGSDGNWSDAGYFTTEGEQEKNFHFLYLTDSQGSNSQDYTVWADTLNQATQRFPDSKFLLMTGDQVDAGALESQWLDYFGKPQKLLMNLPLMAAVGNHEGPYNDNYYYHFHYPNNSIDDPLPPGSVYAYDYGDAHIMVLNTMDMGWDDRQKASFKQEIEWLKHEVARTDKKWKIVAFHKAIYSVGNHALDSDILELREMLYPVFDELGIDVVLQGHDHTFMRSFQMYDNKPIKDVQKDADGNVLNPDGTLYMINNSAATKFYDIKNGVDHFYTDVFLQPKKAVYSGVELTENSFTITSYQSGDDVPFDAYTIVREDTKPNPVEGLAAAQSEDGNRVLTWTKPQDQPGNAIRGFRIYETNGKLGANWNVYVPVTDGQTNYQYAVTGTNPDQAYQFVVKAVNKRDNSAPATVTSAGNTPIAPTAPVVDDAHNTFGWTNAPGYADVTDYEYSLDNGATWKAATANPQPIANGDYASGAVQVRIAALAELGISAGTPLISNKAYTKNDTRDTFLLTGTIERGDQIKVAVNVEELTSYDEEAYLVFQLVKGTSPTPILISAVPLKQTKMAITQYFNETDADYSVKVFVVDQFNSKLTTPVQLARPIELQ